MARKKQARRSNSQRRSKKQRATPEQKAAADKIQDEAVGALDAATQNGNGTPWNGSNGHAHVSGDPIHPSPTQLRSAELDMADGRDRVLVRAAINGSGPGDRFNLGQELRDEMVDAMGHALQIARRMGHAGKICSCVATLQKMEATVQNDQHLALKNERLDAGLATENVQYVYNFAEAVPERE